jgi:branched-chain amino acid transport system substrate-binding protein
MLVRRKPVIVASIAVTVALVSAACSSNAPGGGSSSGGGTTSGGSANEAQTVAKALGINLSKCPSDPTQKLTGTIKLGQTYAQSGGPATAFAPVGKGVKVGVQNFNATSGLPEKFTLTQADDQFAPDKALTATQQLIQQNKVAAMTTTIGTPSVLAIRPLLDSSCVPEIGGAAGGAVANQPSKYPWTVVWTLPSALDARVWVQSIADKYPNGTKVGMFYANDASGKEFLSAVKKYLATTKSTLVSSQSIEDTDAAAPASQVTTLRSSGAKVLVAAPTGSQCVSLMKEVAGQGWKPTFYMSSTCSTSLFDLAGSAANGVYVNQYVKDPTRAPYNTDPAVVAAVKALKQYAPGLAITNSSIAGMMYPTPLFQAIRLAAKSPLGLSRLGILQAATHMTYAPPLLIPGIKYSLNYPTDKVAEEAADLTQYKSSNKSFANIKLYDFEGQLTGVASS